MAGASALWRKLLDQTGDRQDDSPPIGQILLRREALTPHGLDWGLAAQQGTGQKLGRVLLAEGLIGEEDLAAALADQWNLGTVDLAQDPPDETLLKAEDLDIYLQMQTIPWQRIGGLTTFATSDPAVARDALAQLEGGLGFALVVVAPASQIEAAVFSRLGPEVAGRAAARCPVEQSARGLTDMRRVCGLVLVAAPIALFLAPETGAVIVALMMLILSLGTSALRLLSLRAPIEDPPAVAVTAANTVVLADKRPLPPIDLLVPLYREAEVLDSLIEALERIDYPRSLVTVHLLLEESDHATRRAAEAATLPNWMRAIVVPDGAPRTKPRALNAALDLCRGDIVGILDAEDRPDPEQLRTVAARFRAAEPRVACVQCQLSYYNDTENWITRCFMMEYAIWFEVLLRGFQWLRLPIPLGGTSVYFRRSALIDSGAWDAHNVTEDADLGMRLARDGWRTEVVSSVTMEEANCRPGAWIRQRSRWLKGYVVTWLSHMRDPVGLWRDLGTRGALGLNLLLLGGAATYLVMPLFWVSVWLTVVHGTSVWGAALPTPLGIALMVALGAGQIVMLSIASVALRRRGRLSLICWVPVLPFYWTLGAVAAWKAVIEVIAVPYYWDKTRHGVSRLARGQTSSHGKADGPSDTPVSSRSVENGSTATEAPPLRW